MAVEPGRAGGLGFAQAHQRAGQRLLGLAVERAADREVEAVEVVGARYAQQVRQPAAQRRAGLAFGERGHRFARRIGQALERCGQRRIPQCRRDHAGVGHHPQVAVGQIGQRAFVAGAQVVRGPALRHHQRQGLLEGRGLAPALLEGIGRRGVVGLLEQGGDLLEVAPVPGPQAVAHAVDLAPGRARGQRHGVEVVDDDLAPPRQGVLAVEVGAQRGRRHLAQLLGRRVGAAVGRVAVFFELRGQRAAAGGAVVVADQPQGLLGHRLAQARPFDRRIHAGALGVEQLAVLDEQQRRHQQRRHRLEAVVDPLRVTGAVERLVAAVAQGQAGLVFFAVDGEQTLVA